MEELKGEHLRSLKGECMEIKIGQEKLAKALNHVSKVAAGVKGNFANS